MKEEDFVIDDDGLGYADYGQEEWDERHDSEYESDEDDKKRKRKKDRKITSMLAKKEKPKIEEKPVVVTTNDADLMDSIFGDLDNEASLHAAKKPKLDKKDKLPVSLSSTGAVCLLI